MSSSPQIHKINTEEEYRVTAAGGSGGGRIPEG